MPKGTDGGVAEQIKHIWLQGNGTARTLEEALALLRRKEGEARRRAHDMSPHYTWHSPMRAQVWEPVG